MWQSIIMCESSPRGGVSPSAVAPPTIGHDSSPTTRLLVDQSTSDTQSNGIRQAHYEAYDDTALDRTEITSHVTPPL